MWCDFINKNREKKARLINSCNTISRSKMCTGSNNKIQQHNNLRSSNFSDSLKRKEIITGH